MWKSGWYSLYLRSKPHLTVNSFSLPPPTPRVTKNPRKKSTRCLKKKDHMSSKSQESLPRSATLHGQVPPHRLKGNATLPKNVIDPWPQVMSNLQLLPTNDTALLQDQQHLRNTLGNNIRAEYNATQAHGLMEPSIQQVQQVVCDKPPVWPVEGRLIGVVHRLQHSVQGFVRHAKIYEQIHHPGCRSDVALELQCIPLQHGNKLTNGENGLGHPQTISETADLVDHRFVRLRWAALNGGVMDPLDQVLPSWLDVGRIAMIGLVEDLETDVMVTGGVGVFIE